MKTLQRTLIIICLFLTGCASAGIAFSPEQAAIQNLSQHGSVGAVVNPTSIKVLQSQTLNGRTLVMLSFTQNNAGRLEECTWTMGVERSPIGGWTGGSGGGSCSGQVGGGQDQPKEALEVQSGITSGNKVGDLGFSDVNGTVNHPDIHKVRVTWNDGQVQDVAVINNSYLAARNGSYELAKVEGLDDQGASIYTFDRAATAPGKK